MDEQEKPQRSRLWEYLIIPAMILAAAGFWTVIIIGAAGELFEGSPKAKDGAGWLIFAAIAVTMWGFRDRILRR